MSKAKQLIEDRYGSRSYPDFDPRTDPGCPASIAGCIDQLVTTSKAKLEVGETSLQVVLYLLYGAAIRAYGSAHAEMMGGSTIYSDLALSDDFVNSASGKHVWAINRTGRPKSGYVFIITDDAFDKVERKLTAKLISDLTT